jgi:hypothetical protein
MDDQPYVNGFLYSNGRLSIGAPCVAPVLEVTNRLLEPLTVHWLSRVVFEDADGGALFATTSRALVLPGELTLVTNLYPSLGAQRSVLALESESGGFNMFTLHFSEERGYHLLAVSKHWQAGPNPGDAPVASVDIDLPRVAVLQSPPYAPQFEGSVKPKWRHCVIFPVDAKLLVPH